MAGDRDLTLNVVVNSLYLAVIICSPGTPFLKPVYSAKFEFNFTLSPLLRLPVRVTSDAEKFSLNKYNSLFEAADMPVT